MEVKHTHTNSHSSRSRKVVVNFSIKYETKFGENVKLVGSSPLLGSWDPKSALTLRWTEGHKWVTSIEVDDSESFEYKFVVIQDKPGMVKWEEGLNRAVNVSEAELVDGHLIIEDVWESVRVRFSIYYPTSSSEEVVYMTGDPVAIGGWFRPGPVRMELGKSRQLRTDVAGRSWELEVLLPRNTPKFSYRYLVMNEAKKTALWEREPNRQAELGMPVNGVFLQADVNFVAGMMFDQVPPNMFIGPYPQQAADVEKMAAGGVTAVLNVQTDEDHAHRHVDWDAMLKSYAEHNIEVRRFPIRDFNPVDLEQQLMAAVNVLEELIENGYHVYIHCTAGMGRAPAVAVCYLVWCKGYTVGDAVAHVKAHRRVAVPNVPVIERAVQNTYVRTTGGV
eukprot:GILK01006526.1.p1 GENE.GILK01006526.1~~GILK01006526.1.p1  ORF type:complete len:407 (-),score=39.55 GILK01006526.1:48-1220(-)